MHHVYQYESQIIYINGEKNLRNAVTPPDFERDNTKTYYLHTPKQERFNYNVKANSFSRR